MSLSEENRLSWNQATITRNVHKGDQVAFLRTGGNNLLPEDQELLGNVSGLKLVHLLCNSGQDTLSLARLGAIASGVDISDDAIAFAEKLSREAAIPATFYRADVFDWLEMVIAEDKRFDVVYCSFGSVRWISDLDLWTKRIASVLEPGGRFVVVDFHPVAMTFDKDWHHTFPYPSEGKLTTFENGVGSNIAIASDGRTGTRPFSLVTGDPDFSNTHTSYTFDWGIGEIVTALASAGLRIVTLKEYLHSRWTVDFTGMREAADGRTFPPPEVPILPMLYGIVASKS
jgi:SAM-dependent methyltransferase